MTRRDGSQADYRFNWHRSTYVRLMIAAPLFTAVIAGFLVLAFDHTRRNCDKAAKADLARLSAPIQRFEQECLDTKVHDCISRLSEEHLKYLVGSYYGYRGTNGKCATIIRKEGDELQSRAKLGSFPSNKKNERVIYRITLKSFRELPWKVGPCNGKQYGWAPDAAYISSMLKEEPGGYAIGEPDHRAR